MEALKKVVCIVKVDNEKFVKYHVNNLLSFTDYLDKNYKDWRFFNCFNPDTKQQVANFTKSKRPQYKKLIV